MRAVILDQATFGPQALDWQPLLAQPLDWQCHDLTEPHQTQARIKAAEVVLTNKVVLNEALLMGAKELKYVGVMATGTNNIDMRVAKQLGIQVSNVGAYGVASVAQHTLMLMLNLAGNFLAYQKQVKAGDWQTSNMFCLLDQPMLELEDKHLVIVGYGALGKAVGKLARAFGMRVSVAARPGEHGDKQRQPLEILLPQADFVSLHCLLSEQTRHLINQDKLQRMKPSAYLINTARGPLVDEHALFNALISGQIAGAALDVMEQEPPGANNALLNAQLSNLIITPHNAWATQASKQRLISHAADKLAEWREKIGK